jgi:hypothetical protein
MNGRWWLGGMVGLMLMKPAFSPAIPAASITLTVHHELAGQPVQLMSPVTLRPDLTVALHRVEYLLSDVSVGWSDGTTQSLGSDLVLHADLGTLTPGSNGSAVARFDLSAPPTRDNSTMTTLTLHLGLPQRLDSSDPATWPPHHALHPLSTNLHWGWEGGWVFAALEGRSTAPALGKYDSAKSVIPTKPFLYHLARPRCFAAISLPITRDSDGGATAQWTMDLASLWPPGHHPQDQGGLTHSAPADQLAPLLAHRLTTNRTTP